MTASFEQTTSVRPVFLGQHRTITSATFSGSFTLEIRYFFLKYTKYSCEKLPFSTAKSPAECSCRIMRYCPYIVHSLNAFYKPRRGKQAEIQKRCRQGLYGVLRMVLRVSWCGLDGPVCGPAASSRLLYTRLQISRLRSILKNGARRKW